MLYKLKYQRVIIIQQTLIKTDLYRFKRIILNCLATKPQIASIQGIFVS